MKDVITLYIRNKERDGSRDATSSCVSFERVAEGHGTAQVAKCRPGVGIGRV